MPGRNTSTRATADDKQAEDAETPNQLRFHQTLSWRAGKAIPTGELLRRLETLAGELRDIDQEEEDFDKASLVVTAGELAQPNLLSHRDKGVRALTACCLVDVFRICAPDAPFDTPQMQGIFDLFVSHIIPLLQDPMDPYNGQHLHVLNSLSEYKTIILLADLPRPDKLILQLFHSCFDILANPVDGLSKNVEYRLSGLLQSMVDECETLPSEVVDAILTQFLRADSRGSADATTKKGKKLGNGLPSDSRQSQLQFTQLPPAYHAAKNICNSCVERMSRLVSQYFSNVIIDASTSRRKAPPKPKPKHKSRASSEIDFSDSEDLNDPSEDDVKQLEKAHRLLREIWRCSPHVLQNVVPQMEAELSAENVQLRKLATEAIGDMISGIGAAGPPSPPVLDPAAYPGQSLSDAAPEKSKQAEANLPSSSLSFAQSHPSTYQNFMGRKNDKSAEIRAVWSGKIGHILSSSAGGLGLSPQEHQDMARSISRLLIDNDEGVRIAAIEALTLLDFRDFVSKLGPLGGASDSGSLLHNLADRVRDRKHTVRVKAARLLGRLWGVGSEEIAAGNEQVINLLGQIPSKIFNAIYANEVDINYLVDEVLFESLVPLGYPAKKKEKDSNPERTAKKAKNNIDHNTELDVDKVRTERLLLAFKDLDQKAKPVLLSLMGRPVLLSKYMKAYLTRCEDYNGGESNKTGGEIKHHLTRLIDYFSKSFPDQAKTAEDLWKFAKMNDRRSYSLIRFCMAEDSDYQKIYKSYKELKRRLVELPGITPTLSHTFSVLLYRVSNWFYNRSHIQPIMMFAQDEQHTLASAAHELLKDISAKNPGAFKAHGQELCNFLEEHAPRAGRENDAGTLDALKACSAFATRYPDNVPKERKFTQAIVQYATRGTPASTAKYAVSIILASSDKKEMYVKDLLRKCVEGFAYGSDHFLARLAALSQLMLVSSRYMDETKDVDPVLDIALEEVLGQTRTTDHDAAGSWDIEPDEEAEAKIWALKIIVNRLRSYEDSESVRDISGPVYQLLNNLVTNRGELNKKSSTPQAHKHRLRLEAALLQLKLCSHRDFDTLLTPQMFNDLATVAQDPNFQVRDRFVRKIKKYLGQNRLPSRFYTIIFLLAFEPTRKLQRESLTWLRARATSLAKEKKMTMEPLLARFLSLLAHHPDFSSDPNDLKDTAQYIIFYMQAISTSDNLSLLYHVAQRVKSVQDGIDPARSDNLYYLADLTVAVITHYGNTQNWSIQSYTGKVRLPSAIFAALPNHEAAQAIATTQYLAEDAFEELEAVVKASFKSQKRKADDELSGPPKKRASQVSKNGNQTKTSKTLPIRRTKAKKSSTVKPGASAASRGSASVERRRSGRGAGPKSYAEHDESEDDAEMETWDEEGEEQGEEEDGPEQATPGANGLSEGDKENSTPPETSRVRRQALRR